MDLVFLHGPAAAGKLTVARALAARLNFGLFHNHLIVDALTAVFPFGTPSFVRLREEFWLATFEEAATTGASLIFTFAPESTVVSGFPDRVRRAVESRGGRVRFVGLTVGLAEQERRIGLPSRLEFAKLTDVQTLRRIRASEESTEQPPVELTVDSERHSPEESAAHIIDALGLVPAPENQRYPDV
jgi:hypothetical protein